jgi:hypothetical protein
MKKLALAMSGLLALVALCPGVIAQDKPKSESKSTTLKLQVTVTEREGEKKVTNLPYSFFVKAEDGSPSSPRTWTKLRTGSRVPVYVGKDGGMQYIDVGTNIDARAVATDDAHFDVSLNIERSWVEGEVLVPTEKVGDAEAGHFKEPIIRQFKTELTLPMRDGQTAESTQAADPGNGRVLTITVTANVVK